MVLENQQRKRFEKQMNLQILEFVIAEDELYSYYVNSTQLKVIFVEVSLNIKRLEKSVHIVAYVTVVAYQFVVKIQERHTRKAVAERYLTRSINKGGKPI